MRKTLMRIYRRLYAHYGPQRWWPGDTPFEVMVGAILTQNTAWANVEKAIENLKRRRALSPQALDRLNSKALAGAIRPAGYFNVKVKRLKAFISFFLNGYGGDVAKMRRQDLHPLRNELLDVNGIGPETADSILLYALNKPIFVIDAYTKRILSRHGLIKKAASYEDVQSLFMDNLPQDAKLFNEYHALLVGLGKTLCTRRNPRCKECPLSGVRSSHNT